MFDVHRCPCTHAIMMFAEVPTDTCHARCQVPIISIPHPYCLQCHHYGKDGPGQSLVCNLRNVPTKRAYRARIPALSVQ
uniref:Uncharacterized protein n=1 Tax=Arion vulgaris TaxID=1028688 RepID=A0A0B7APS6_9EUPU